MSDTIIDPTAEAKGETPIKASITIHLLDNGVVVAMQSAGSMSRQEAIMMCEVAKLDLNMVFHARLAQEQMKAQMGKPQYPGPSMAGANLRMPGQ